MISVSSSPSLNNYLIVHMHTHICIHVRNCARTNQMLETELENEDAESSDDESGAPGEGTSQESGARLSGALQDQRGTIKYHGKVSCCMWHNMLVRGMAATNQ